MQVKKIMTKNPACCTPDSTLQEVAHMMQMYDCGCIPVINDHQAKRAVGTITDRDITIRTFAANKNPLEMKASDIMTTDIATVTPEMSVEDCLRLMEDKKIRRVLVADKDGKCIGIIAQADLVEHETHSAQTANFIREVSESDRSNDRGFDSDRSRFNETKTPRRNNYSIAQNESRETHSRSQEKHHKPQVKKESFFNSTMLLTLLGSVGLGAGLKYYLGQEGEKKHRATGGRIKTYNADTKNLADKKSTGSSAHTPAISGKTTTSSDFSTTSLTEDRDSITGSVDSFDKTNDDRDLKPITEVGRTATNS